MADCRARGDLVQSKDTRDTQLSLRRERKQNECWLVLKLVNWSRDLPKQKCTKYVQFTIFEHGECSRCAGSHRFERVVRRVSSVHPAIQQGFKVFGFLLQLLWPTESEYVVSGFSTQKKASEIESINIVIRVSHQQERKKRKSCCLHEGSKSMHTTAKQHVAVSERGSRDFFCSSKLTFYHTLGM